MYFAHNIVVSDKYAVHGECTRPLDTHRQRPHLVLLLFVVDDDSIRSPGPVTPCEADCEGFNLAYSRIATSATAARSSGRPTPSTTYPSTTSTLENNIDQKVDDAIEVFLRSLSQIGPELLSVRELCFERLNAYLALYLPWKVSQPNSPAFLWH